jgi:stress-induced morphogen
MHADQIREKLEASFPDAILSVMDLTGGGDHWQVSIQSAAFMGKSKVEQHQLVYKALEEWLKTQEIHALALTTSLP